MADGGVEEINKAVDNLTSASHKLAEAMYKASSATPPPAGEAPKADEPKKDENVVDAEFVDVDDKK
jgi:molecular chaperone DnaK